MHRRNLYPYADGAGFRDEAPERIFTQFYQDRSWLLTNQESASGEGSSLHQTRLLREGLPALLRKWGITSLLDLPCGDFNWMQHVDLSGIAYTGGDIVGELIAENRRLYGAPGRRFEQLDLLKGPLPQADAVFCRDCLVHFSYAHIEQAIAAMRRSGIRYLLTTHFPEETEAIDIDTGGWRPINWLLPPFHWPAPLDLLNEGCTEMDGAFADKSVGLWEL